MDLEDTINSAIEDSELTTDDNALETTNEPEADTDPAVGEETAPEATSDPTEPITETPGSTQVASPVSKAKEEFAAVNPVTGRENRLPYSRHVKIKDKAVKEAVDAKVKELEGGFSPRLQQYETKVKDYEGRLQKVAEFENVMVNDRVKFLSMLVKMPQYAQILAPLFSQNAQPEQKPQSAPADPYGDMPQPDKDAGDGTMVYSFDGLKSLLDWNAKQVEARVAKRFEDRYAPMEKDYTEFQKVQEVIPHVNRQIAEAQTWPLFKESEAEITNALAYNPTWNLERAYQAVVLPKMQAAKAKSEADTKAERDKMRAELLAELRKAPSSTSAPSSTGKARTAPLSGPHSLEDVINQAIAASGLK